MQIDKFHNLTSVYDLASAISQIMEWASVKKIDPDTIYIPTTGLTLVSQTLSDQSVVYDVLINSTQGE